MAVTPDQAIQECKNAHLTPEEMKDADDAEKQIDNHLSGRNPPEGWPEGKPFGWNGTHTSVDFGGQLPPRVTAEIVRRFARAGWNVMLEPLPATQRGPRGEILVLGVRFNFVPTWKAPTLSVSEFARRVVNEIRQTPVGDREVGEALDGVAQAIEKSGAEPTIEPPPMQKPALMLVTP